MSKRKKMRETEPRTNENTWKLTFIGSDIDNMRVRGELFFKLCSHNFTKEKQNLSLVISYTKINSRWIKDLNVNIKATKTFRSIVKTEYLYDLEVRKIFFKQKNKMQTLKEKRLVHTALLTLKSYIYQKYHNKSGYITHKLWEV